MTWQPGTPVTTVQDHADWEAWRKERKREAQRWRRARNPRIDYYPDAEAVALIYGMTRPGLGGDLSSVINRIVRSWAIERGVIPPE
ncbi:hypothetical protein [Roseateles sp.]|uniref:hypothetical protein n=1 Tax=Roseateles sp. TaxID=1971397 RepID=UPI0035A1C47C